MAAVVSAGPNTITYQACVTTAAGTQVPDGAYGMQFNFYIVPTGGSWVWQGMETTVTAKNGLFSVVVGDGRPFGTLFSNRSDLWPNRLRLAQAVTQRRGTCEKAELRLSQAAKVG